MNVKELIEKYEYLNHNCFRRVDTSEVLRDLKKLDEPQKVTIPGYIAEKIDYCKETEGYSLFSSMDYCYNFKKCTSWLEFKDNQEVFARAWIFGYEVEIEKRYLVKIKGLNPNYVILKYQPYDKNWFFGREQENDFFRQRHTRKQLEAAGFGEVFNSTLFEVEEVEE